MKYSAFDDMYYGERGSFDCVKVAKETIEQTEEVIRYDQKMTELLGSLPELLETFENFKDAMDEQLSLIAHDYYKEGLSFGVQLGLDIAYKEEK